MGRGKTYAYDEDADTRLLHRLAAADGVRNLYMGHLYRFTLQDFVARFDRMRDDTVYFPFGYDDNGIASERLTERELGIRHQDYARREFQELCRDGHAVRGRVHAGRPVTGDLHRLGNTYKTIAPDVQRVSQLSFLTSTNRQTTRGYWSC